MKARLMFRDRDVVLEEPLRRNAGALIQDLELGTVLDFMASGDAYLRDRAERTLLCGLTDPDAIRYRQGVLGDCLAQPAALRQLYELAVDALESRRKARFFYFRDSPEALLQKSLGMLDLLADALERLRGLAELHGPSFHSEGFSRFFAMIDEELDDEYLQTVRSSLRELRFRRGALISAELGRGNRGTNYVLRKPHDTRLLERLTPGSAPTHSFTIPARDDHGLTAVSELRSRGIRLAANALAQSTDHILSFFGMLRVELGFFVGCLNLHEQLAERGEPTRFPEPSTADAHALSARGLYDVSLAFHLGARVVPNHADADGKRLILITGANQGGKSTFLRSLGLAQLMMQAGMFVGAESFGASVCGGVFTHFKREEDRTMTQGKLDEELGRMSDIAELLGPGDLFLGNESFSSTNEREGSEIARQVIRAMIDSGVRVGFVTHLFDLAQGLYREDLETALFLRAERLPDGGRTFRVVPGEPLATSYGKDSFRRIFVG